MPRVSNMFKAKDFSVRTEGKIKETTPEYELVMCHKILRAVNPEGPMTEFVARLQSSLRSENHKFKSFRDGTFSHNATSSNVFLWHCISFKIVNRSTFGSMAKHR